MSRKTPRLYVPLDARFFDDDAVIRAGERAAYLYLNILCAIKADDADGTITLRKIARLHVDNYRQRLEKLLAVGLLLELDSPENDDITYLVVGWGKWNMTSAERQRRVDSGRFYAQKRWGTHGKPNGGPIADPMLRQDKKERKGMTSLGDLVDNLRNDLGIEQ